MLRKPENAAAAYGKTVEEARLKAASASLDGTFGSFLAYWWAELAATGRVGRNTLRLREWAIGNWLVPHVGKVMLDSLLPEDLEKVYAAMVGKGLTAPSIERVRVCAGQALDHALRRSMVSRNVSRLAVMPPGAKNRPREHKPRRGRPTQQ